MESLINHTNHRKFKVTIYPENDISYCDLIVDVDISNAKSKFYFNVKNILPHITFSFVADNEKVPFETRLYVGGYADIEEKISKDEIDIIAFIQEKVKTTYKTNNLPKVERTETE